MSIETEIQGKGRDNIVNQLNKINLIHRFGWYDREHGSICMESFWKIGPLSLHVEINASVVNTSNATIYKMTENGWKPLINLPQSQMTFNAASVQKASQIHDPEQLDSAIQRYFRLDEDRLLDLAMAILK